MRDGVFFRMRGARCLAGSLWAAVLLTVVVAYGAEHGGEAAIEPLIRQAQADVAAALESLTVLRDRIDRERLPLQAAHRSLTEDVREKRLRLQRLQEAGRMEAEKRLRLERETTRLEEEAQFALTALSEYRRGVETRMQAAELQAFGPALARMDAALAGAGSDDAGRVASAVLGEASDWNRRRSGGLVFEGTALDAGGTEREGRYLVIGPLVYFRDQAGAGALVTGTPGSILPSLYPGHRTAERQAIAGLVDGMGSAAVPVDVSGGAAMKRARAAEGWVVQIRKGGFVMVPLLLTGVLSLLIGVWKSLHLYRLRRAVAAPLDTVADAVRTRDWGAAQEAVKRLPAPLSVLVGEALEHRHAPREYLEEILHERLLSMTPVWERHLGTLAVFGGVAPLLGLLGTVTGMIHTFELVTLFGTGEARLLSGGISEALITTKFGLGIAIPVLVVHAFLVRRLRVIIGMLESGVARFVNLLSGGGVTPA